MISTTGSFCMNQPVSSSVATVASAPAAASSISALPSGWLTAADGIFGRRVRSSGSGVPQIVLTVPQWMRWPGLTAITAAAPAASRPATKFGSAKPSMITTLPATSAPAFCGLRSSGVPPLEPGR